VSAQVAADLRAAAEVLRRDGWTRNTYQSADGCKCALGALHYVASNGLSVSDADLTLEEEARAEAATNRLATHLGGAYWITVLTYNDSPGRTADEVIAALEAAADAAERGAL
jgi:hypothetical protein